uniref:Uncharacterized protein n=1 Tax=viral metagenome TaxID=1070528 RepID=A0A6C0DHN2_9ZZZZ
MFDIIIITGILITTFTMIIGTNHPNTLFGLNVGLIVILFGVLMCLIKKWNESFSVKNIYELVLDVLPYFFIIFSIIISVYIIGKYSKKISSDLVSDSFKNFKNWFLIFTLIQVTSILYYNSRPNDKKKSDFLIYVLGIFNSVFLIIMYTSLVYFTTDGFRNITM